MIDGDLAAIGWHSDGIALIHRGTTAPDRHLRDDIRVVFRALKGPAHVAMTIPGGLAEETARRQRFLVGGKMTSRAAKTTPKRVGESPNVDGSRGPWNDPEARSGFVRAPPVR